VTVNLRGLWRLLVLVYVLFAVVVAIAATLFVNESIDCQKQLPVRLEEHARWERLPRCAGNYVETHCDASGTLVYEPYVSSCEPTPGTAIAYALGALLAGAVLLFGGGLAVRWVYRGLVRPSA
jgi:hypothetical protein